MICREFERWVSTGEGEDALLVHVRSCGPCRRRHHLHEALGSLPPVSIPPDLDERVLAAARRPLVRPLRPVLIRTAAAVLALLAGFAGWLIQRPGEEIYQPRHFRVVESDSPLSGAPEETLEEIHEELYGPSPPIVIAAEGGSQDASRRR